MEYSKNGVDKWHESQADFTKNIDRIAKIIGVKKGELIHWREHSDAKVYSQPYGKKYGR